MKILTSILFFGSMSGGRIGSKNSSFNTRKGRVNPKGFGKHVGLEEANKNSNIKKGSRVDKRVLDIKYLEKLGSFIWIIKLPNVKLNSY